jgi:hypothetical protein
MGVLESIVQHLNDINMSLKELTQAVSQHTNRPAGTLEPPAIVDAVTKTGRGPSVMKKDTLAAWNWALGPFKTKKTRKRALLAIKHIAEAEQINSPQNKNGDVAATLYDNGALKGVSEPLPTVSQLLGKLVKEGAIRPGTTKGEKYRYRLTDKSRELYNNHPI